MANMEAFRGFFLVVTTADYGPTRVVVRLGGHIKKGKLARLPLFYVARLAECYNHGMIRLIVPGTPPAV
jgi:hypothetical protein